MNVQNVIDIALTAGEILLENGAENYRIEDTVSKICKSYGFNSECIAMSNGLLLLVEDCNLEKITSMKKIKEKHVDLYRIELINSFSRKLEKSLLTYEDAKKSLEKIKNAPNFTLNVRTMAACMTGFIYTLFFNGSILDGLIAIIVCLITYIVFEKISKKDSNITNCDIKLSEHWICAKGKLIAKNLLIIGYPRVTSNLTGRATTPMVFIYMTGDVVKVDLKTDLSVEKISLLRKYFWHNFGIVSTEVLGKSKEEVTDIFSKQFQVLKEEMNLDDRELLIEMIKEPEKYRKIYMEILPYHIKKWCKKQNIEERKQ